MSLVLVVGGTGVVGSQITRLLLERGDDVFLLVRDRMESRDNAQQLVEMGAKIVSGDLDDPESLKDAAENIEYILATAATLDNSFSAGYKALVESAERYGVKHFIYLSNWPRLDPLLPMFQGKQEIEKIVMNSQVPSTVYQAEPFLGYVVNAMIRPSLEYGYPFGFFAKDENHANSGRHYWISEMDVAKVMVESMGIEGTFNKSFLIGGETALTLSEIVDKYGKLHDTTVPTMVCPTPPQGVPQFIYDIVSQLHDYDSNVPDDMKSLLGIQMTSVDDVIMG